MTPKVGEVYMLDLGMQAKVRPVVIMSREDPSAPRALSVFVPLTSEFRNSNYEVAMPRVPWLARQSYANCQAVSAVAHHELKERRGKFDAAAVAKIKEALRWTFDL